MHETDAEELAEWQAFMIIQREDMVRATSQTGGQPTTDPDTAEDQLKKLFGKRE